MAKTVSVYDPIEVRIAYHRAQARTRRVAQEATSLAIMCVATVLLTMGLYLVAAPELRGAILSAFLGFDQPSVTFAGHPPSTP